VDLARSIDFRDGHVPGALWGIRTRLAKLADRLTGDRQIIVTAPEEAQARLAAAELQGFAKAPVKILAGGTKAWATAGFPMAADRRDPADAECVDFYLRPYDRNEGIEEAMHAYLSWEIDLVHEVKKDGDAPFGAWA
jgi:rhodanese-related sulfurtransferase